MHMIIENLKKITQIRLKILGLVKIRTMLVNKSIEENQRVLETPKTKYHEGQIV